MKIVSLLPAATQIIHALGRSHQLVGVSHSCETVHPDIPRLTRSRVPIDLPADETDRLVRQNLQKNVPLFQLDIAKLIALQPDLIITQSLCNACAIDGNDVKQALHELGAKTSLFEWSPTSLEEVFHGISEIGHRIDADNAAEELVTKMKGRFGQIRSDRTHPQPTVVFLEWLTPMFCSGHWIPELIEIAGGRELIGQAGGRSRPITPDDLIHADPDIIIACCCGWSAGRAQFELDRLTNQPWWSQLHAVQTGQVHLLDAEFRFTMPGPNLADDAQHLSRLFAVVNAGTACGSA